MEHEIIVRGTAEARVAPDRATIHATIDADGSNRDDAYRSASESAARVDAVLAARAEAIERTVTAALLVQPLTKWKRGEAIRTGWRATRRSDIEVMGFEQLGELLAELAAAGATIAGPDWHVDATNPVHGEVRRQAAEEARRRAEAYGVGLGLTVGPVTWVAEPGLRKGSSDPGYLGGAVAAFGGQATRMAGAEEEVVIDVSPADIVVSASIEVAFGIVTG